MLRYIFISQQCLLLKYNGNMGCMHSLNTVRNSNVLIFLHKCTLSACLYCIFLSVCFPHQTISGFIHEFGFPNYALFRSRIFIRRSLKEFKFTSSVSKYIDNTRRRKFRVFRNTRGNKFFRATSQW